MKVTIKFEGASEKHFSKPWIGKVSHWPVGGRASLEWGTFRGSIAEGGEVEIDAQAGDIVRWGQKDYRKGKHGSPSKWGQVLKTGEVNEITESAARLWYDGNNGKQENKKSDAQALAETAKAISGASGRDIAKAALLALPFEERCNLIDEVLALGSV